MKKPLLPIAAIILSGGAVLYPAFSASRAAPAKKAAAQKSKPVKKTNKNLVALPIVLPKAAFNGTPKNIPPGTTVEKPTGKPRAPFYAPRGVVNLAKGRTVTSSDPAPIIGELKQITDGDKAAGDGFFVDLAPGTQWVQIDLGKSANLYAIVLWHFHGEARVYRDVVVQVADNAAFTSGVRTIFNNDADNSARRGLGRDHEFFELAEGKLIPAKGIKARYVRLFSSGNTSDDQNAYTEVEVWGK